MARCPTPLEMGDLLCPCTDPGVIKLAEWINGLFALATAGMHRSQTAENLSDCLDAYEGALG
jgi:hypothetical protein